MGREFSGPDGCSFVSIRGLGFLAVFGGMEFKASGPGSGNGVVPGGLASPSGGCYEIKMVSH